MDKDAMQALWVVLAHCWTMLGKSRYADAAVDCDEALHLIAVALAQPCPPSVCPHIVTNGTTSYCDLAANPMVTEPAPISPAMDLTQVAYDTAAYVGITEDQMRRFLGTLRLAGVKLVVDWSGMPSEGDAWDRGLTRPHSKIGGTE